MGEDGRFLSVYRAFLRHKRWIPLWLLALTGLACASLFFIPFDNTLQAMLPAGGAAQRMMKALSDARFADKVAISLSVQDAAADRPALKAAAEQLRKTLGPPLVSRIVTDLPQTNQWSAVSFFLERAPQILGESDLEDIDRQLTPQGVHEALRQMYLQLVRPEGLFMGRRLQSDPLGIRGRVLRKLGQVSAALGYDVSVEDSLLVSRDGRHALLVAETPVNMTDSGGSRKFVAYLKERLAALPPGVSADMVCGHLHTLSNEKTIKRDIALTNTVASLAFIVLLVACFRDFRSVMLVFMIPVVAALAAIPLTALLVDRMALLVIGFGSVIAGIAVDYGMHVYAVVRHSDNAEEAVRHVAQPVFFSTLTTIALFAAFFVSRIAGYHQLAWFSILALLLSLGLALFVLPHFVRRRGRSAAPSKPAAVETGRSTRGRSIVYVTLWVITMVTGVPLASRVGFDAEITRLDGTEKPILAAEERFRKTWGDASRNVAFALVSAPTYEAAAEGADRILKGIALPAGTNGLGGLSLVWPPTTTRAENAARWRRFWRDGREERLRRLLSEQGAEFDFAPGAFDPFFAGLYAGTEDISEPADNAMLNALKDRFVQRRDGAWQIVAFLPDRSDIVAQAGKLAAEQSDAIVVSGRTIAGALSEGFSGEIARMSAVAVILIVVVTFGLLQNARAALIALVPPLTAVVWLLALLALMGFPLNVATLMAGVVVFGLSIDYSFVMMHSYGHHLSGVTRFAVHLSAITTVVGTGALLFAHHPALFTIGLTLTIGVTAGYIAAMFVVPALYELVLAGRGPGEGSDTT